MILWILTGAVLVLIILSFAAGYYFYNLSLNPRINKSIFFGPPSQDSSKEAKERWFHDNCKRKVVINSFDNLELAGYVVENPLKSEAWVIIAHGYTNKASSMSHYAEAFYNMGFNVLLPDARGHGESQGSYIGMGWHERLDIASWSDYINTHYTYDQIVLFGVSMGAATVMMASGESLPHNVRAVIEDCGYTSVKEEFCYQLKNYFHLPAFPILPAASLITRIKAGYSILYDGSAIKQVEKSHIPTLFIHGTKDTFVPFFMLDKLYQSASCPKERLVIEGAGHAKSCQVNPDIYWGTIKSFLSTYVAV